MCFGEGRLTVVRVDEHAVRQSEVRFGRLFLEIIWSSIFWLLTSLTYLATKGESLSFMTQYGKHFGETISAIFEASFGFLLNLSWTWGVVTAFTAVIASFLFGCWVGRIRIVEATPAKLFDPAAARELELLQRREDSISRREQAYNRAIESVGLPHTVDRRPSELRTSDRK